MDISIVAAVFIIHIIFRGIVQLNVKGFFLVFFDASVTLLETIFKIILSIKRTKYGLFVTFIDNFV